MNKNETVKQMYYNSKIRRGENMKPMIKYRGGKSREIKEIIKFIPEYKGKYIEPFFGGGADRKSVV